MRPTLPSEPAASSRESEQADLGTCAAAQKMPCPLKPGNVRVGWTLPFSAGRKFRTQLAAKALNLRSSSRIGELNVIGKLEGSSLPKGRYKWSIGAVPGVVTLPFPSEAVPGDRKGRTKPTQALPNSSAKKLEKERKWSSVAATGLEAGVEGPCSSARLCVYRECVRRVVLKLPRASTLPRAGRAALFVFFLRGGTGGGGGRGFEAT